MNIVGGIERSPCPLADPRYADVRVTIREVQFNNLKGATLEEMRRAWAPFAGTEQPVAVLCETEDAAATMLRDKGYLAAVQVLTQRIEDGGPDGNALRADHHHPRPRWGPGAAPRLRLRPLPNKLTEDEYFDRDRAERHCCWPMTCRGHNVQLTLRPAGTGPGELIGEVDGAAPALFSST